MRRLPPTLAALALLAVGVVGCASEGTTPGSAPSPTTVAAPATTATIAPSQGEPVVKDVLATDVDPEGAPGSTLTLIRYTIAPGAELAPHVHPGVQMAHIDAGTLTYTIESGTAEVRRAGSSEAMAVTGPTTITLEAGDSVVEPDEMVHFGANRADVPVVISATLLTRTDAGLSIAVTTSTTVP